MMKDNAESGDGGEGGGEEMGNIYISSEQIIKEVQKYRCLYDPAVPEHKDRDVVRDAWLSVSQAVVGEPWESMNSAEKDEAERDLKRKWKFMRDHFRRTLKRGINRTPRDKRTGIIKWKMARKSITYDEKMSFLLETEHYKHFAEAIKNSSKPPNKGESTEGQVSSNEVARSSQDSTILRPEQNKKKTVSSFNQTTQKDNTSKDSPTSCHSSSMVPKHSVNPGLENPDRLFLLSLLPRVSALNSLDKMDFQIGIMKLLLEYETEDSNS